MKPKPWIAFLLLATFFSQSIAPLAWGEESEATSETSTTDTKYQIQAEEFERHSEAAERFTFKSIPRDLGGIMVDSFWGWGSLGFALGSGLTAGLTQVDHDLQDSFQPNALFGSTANDVIGWTLSPYVIGGVSLFTWIGAHAGKKKKLELTARAITEALFLSMSITTIAKYSFDRTRPNGDSLSFPSGHATGIYTAAGVLTSFYGWKGAIPSYALASLVSINRIDSYNHFLSDVVMGAVLGSVIGYGAGKFHKKEHPNYFISSQVTHDGATLQFVHNF